MADPGALLGGVDLFGEVARPSAASVLKQKFIFPPFTVLDGRSGDWQERKRQWLSLGFKSEVGRAENLLSFSDAALAGYCPDCGGAGETSPGMPCASCGGSGKAAPEEGASSGTSIFDPVLAELCYTWFCPAGGQIVDPFAGGSVRGLIAAALGLHYWGSELRREQVDANREQAAAFGMEPMPQWVCGDSLDTLGGAPDADFIFSCPPYGDLEKYSDDPRDLSAMTWDGFMEAYYQIINLAVLKLKRNRFAAFVTGDFRDPQGFYRHLKQETVGAFESAGARLYNSAVLVNAVGSAAMRANRIFGSGRKLVKLHQDLVVFCKGDPSLAATAAKQKEESNGTSN